MQDPDEIIKSLKYQIKKFEKMVANGTTWEHAHEIIDDYHGKFVMYEAAFFSLVTGDTDNHIIDICKNRVHESRWEDITKYIRPHSELQGKISRLEREIEQLERKIKRLEENN